MRHDAERLARVLDGSAPGAGLPHHGDAVFELAALGMDVSIALSKWRLAPGERERIFARVLESVDEKAAGRRRIRLGHIHPLDHWRGAVLGGAAALSVAAIGIAFVRQRRAHALA
jgi:hypothetical protein